MFDSCASRISLFVPGLFACVLAMEHQLKLQLTNKCLPRESLACLKIRITDIFVFAIRIVKFSNDMVYPPENKHDIGKSTCSIRRYIFKWLEHVHCHSLVCRVLSHLKIHSRSLRFKGTNLASKAKPSRGPFIGHGEKLRLFGWVKIQLFLPIKNDMAMKQNEAMFCTLVVCCYLRKWKSSILFQKQQHFSNSQQQPLTIDH